jgi:hypothetical protein
MSSDARRVAGPDDAVRFRFAFSPAYRILGLPFAITPATAYADVSAEMLTVRFGFWGLRTPLTNISGVESSGGYSLVKTAGPAHLSLADRGVTFATNAAEGVCLRFIEPVRAIDPTGRILHPGATLTLALIDDFCAALRTT